MLPYAVYLHFDLLESFPGGGSSRRRIIDFVRLLRDEPYTRGDFTEKDAAYRERHIKIIGDYAITYQVNDAVRVVMIIGIHPAGR